MDKNIPPGLLDGISGRKPPAKLGIAAIQGRNSETESVSHVQILLLSISQVPGEHHRFVIAEQERQSSASIFRLTLKLVQQPENLRDILSPVEDIPNNHQMITAERPFHTFVHNPVPHQKFHENVHLPVRIRHNEGPAGLPVIPPWPGFPHHRHVKGILPALSLDPHGKVPGQSRHENSIEDIAFRPNADHPCTAILIVKQIRPVRTGLYVTAKSISPGHKA